MSPEREKMIRATYNEMVRAAPAFNGDHLWWPVLHHTAPGHFGNAIEATADDAALLFTWRLKRAYQNGRPGLLRFVECEGVQLDPIFRPDEPEE